MEKHSDNYNEAMKTSYVSILVNALLSLIKLLAGIVAHSNAMISDSIHSLSDVGSTLIVMAGIRISEKQSDENHPYGHERFECIASILLAVALASTGLGIGWGGIKVIASGAYTDLVMPGKLALGAAIVSIVVKELMFRYTRMVARKINSSALMADAWHHRSDAFSSIGALVGIAGARMGYAMLDPLAGVVIAVFILKAAWDICMDSLDKLVDKACDSETNQQIHQCIIACEGVERVDLLKTRLFGSKIYVDVEIAVDADLNLRDAHAIAERVHHKIEKDFPLVKHCMVHVNPVEIEGRE